MMSRFVDVDGFRNRIPGRYDKTVPGIADPLVPEDIMEHSAKTLGIIFPSVNVTGSADQF